MNAWRFILSSLRHYRRIHLAVALGVAVATAVLTGALLVGDSVRGSLRDLTLQRLGRIDSAIVAGHMFRAELANEVAGDAGFKAHFASVQPAILLNGTLQAGSRGDTRRATSISVIGCQPQFWSIGSGGPAGPLSDEDAAITESLANELNVRVGDSILLQIPVAGSIPADSPLGAKQLEKTSRSRRFRVAAVLPPLGLARFGLVPSQQLPRNVFVTLAALQKLVDQPGKANAILVATDRPAAAAGDDAQSALRTALRPRLEDYGVRVEELASPTHCVQISADELVLPAEVVRAVGQAFNGESQPVVTYLANTIAVGGRKIPYSTITGVRSVAQLGPLLDDAGKPIELADNEIVLNRWAADDLKAKVGDDLRVTFYEPESTHGRLREHQPPPVFKLKAIVELKDKEGRASAAADPRLTPEMPGVTDQKSISDWDLPFELVEKVRPEDEKYWDEYRTTPKAFVSLGTAERLWASRWGAISLLRLPADESLRESNPRFGEARLRDAIDPAAMGVSVLPVKQLGLAASAGTTPFDGLFLGFSFFLIAAAVMLVALLFQLGIQQRMSELGTLAAVGVGRRRISRLLSQEGMIVAAAGATAGVAAGVLYAWLVIYALTTWWVAAISTPFLRLHVGWASLVIGWFVGVIVSWMAIRWSIWRTARVPVNRLLAGALDVCQSKGNASRRGSRLYVLSAVGLTIVMTALVFIGQKLGGEAQAGVFFATGALLLVYLLTLLRYRMISRGSRRFSRLEFRLPMLAALNMARNPGRSTLTIGLVAAASFLIVAVSAFRLNTGEAGTGGFEFLATSDQPIHYDLNTADGRRELGFSDAASQRLNDWRVFSLRVAAGADASCLNLYQPKQPRVLGVPAALLQRGGFGWSAAASGYADNPWTALDADLGRDASGTPIVPGVLDMSTAVYSLHLGGVGSQLTINDAGGRPVTVQVVGLLENSVLQGNLLVSEGNFLKLFPDTGGYRFFLIERVKGDVPRDVSGDGIPTRQPGAPMPATLESALAEEGFDVVDAREQLAQFLAVQNTYLSTFQSLGALGLLLGTIGLAVVQLRSVLERRGELALMRAGGFGRKRLTWMVVCENAVLLVGGLAVGCIAAAVALIPQWAPHGASVPWGTLAALLGAIAIVGVVAGWLATRRALVAPILSALRGD
jgi:putative ABC transport system permease protein